jgi:hypothetical protein
MHCRLTKKAEPPPTRDVNRDSGTASANGGWLRRLVRRHHGLLTEILTGGSFSVPSHTCERVSFVGDMELNVPDR